MQNYSKLLRENKILVARYAILGRVEVAPEVVFVVKKIDQDKVKKDGVTIVPLELFLTHGFAKIEIGLAKGKKIYDKREAITKKTQERDIARLVKR